jgi:hypothetical protein
MTVSTVYEPDQYLGNGVTTVFPITNQFYVNTDIIATSTVIATGVNTVLALTTDYTLAGGSGSAGSLTTLVAPASGTRLTIEVSLPYTQESDYIDGNEILAETVETSFDRSVIQTQQLRAILSRTAAFPVTYSSGYNAVLPIPVAGKILGWSDSLGTIENVDFGSLSGTPLSVVLTSPASGDLLFFNGSNWINTASGDLAFLDSIGAAQFNKLAITGQTSATPATGDSIIFSDVSDSGNVKKATIADVLSLQGTISIAAFTNKILYGCTLSNNVTDATNDIDIAAGSCVSDDGTTVMTVTAITKRLDAAWAVGTGNGGLDTGSIANTTYHLWVINRPDTNVTDVLFSASATSPTLPTNYTKKKRIGAVIREGGVLVPFRQVGNQFERITPVTIVATTSSTSVASIPALTPGGIKTIGLFSGSIDAPSTGNAVLFSDADIASPPAPGLTNGILSFASGNAAGGGQFTCITSATAATQVKWQATAARSTYVTTRGWVDYQI